jgi:hypothetical protein
MSTHLPLAGAVHAAEGAAKAALLRKRFAPWYYVIAGETLAQITRARP